MRIPRATIGLNGPDQPHLEPVFTPTHRVCGLHLSSALSKPSSLSLELYCGFLVSSGELQPGVAMGLLILTSQCGLGWLSYAADWEGVRDEIAKALLKPGKCLYLWSFQFGIVSAIQVGLCCSSL